MQVAVTASSGRLGRAILINLKQMVDPGSIVAVARDPARVDVQGVAKRRGDYQSVESMTEAFKGVDSAVLISAPVTPGIDRVKLHRNVIAAGQAAGVGKMVYTSIIGNGDEAGTLFEATQNVNRQTERDLQESGMAWAIGRNGLYLELDTAHIVRAQETGVYSNNGGDGRCGYLTIDELGYALARLAVDARHNGKIYNLIGKPRTQAELVAEANEVFGLSVEYRPISDAANVERFMADPAIAARGREVAEMLTGCFQCIRKGAFDVPAEFAQAAGRPPKSIREMMTEIRDAA